MYEMTPEQVDAYRQIVQDLARSKVAEPVEAAAIFRRGGHAAKSVVSKGGLGAIAYAAVALFAKKQAGGLPDQALLVATPTKVHAFKAKAKGQTWTASDEVAVWDRSSLVVRGVPSMGVTMLKLESPAEGEKVSLAPVGLRDDPVALEFIAALSTGEPE